MMDYNVTKGNFTFDRYDNLKEFPLNINGKLSILIEWVSLIHPPP